MDVFWDGICNARLTTVTIVSYIVGAIVRGKRQDSLSD